MRSSGWQHPMENPVLQLTLATQGYPAARGPGTAVAASPSKKNLNKTTQNYERVTLIDAVDYETSRDP
jgi:hypothetical protein